MLWEGRSLRDIREADIRALVESGLEEHLHLEYKSELYGNGDKDRREFLLDVCMFANAEGGILLLGVPERRDANGQPTGTPDQGAELGLEVPNPEAVLAGYDARVMEAIEERLPLESAPIDVGNGRRVLALRIGNSILKPHSVRYDRHIYFPSRRERQRYPMNVREIKELVMRTASRLEEAKAMLRNLFNSTEDLRTEPVITFAIIPVFSEDFLVDVRDAKVRRAIAEFSPRSADSYREPAYTFDGIERVEPDVGTVRLQRNGLLALRRLLPVIPPRRAGAEQPHDVVHVGGLDALLRNFISRAGKVFEAGRVTAPFVLGMKLENRRPLAGAIPLVEFPSGYREAGPLSAGERAFPYMQVVDLAKVNEAIRPLCDQAHQMFGEQRSPSFNEQGEWIARY